MEKLPMLNTLPRDPDQPAGGGLLLTSGMVEWSEWSWRGYSRYCSTIQLKNLASTIPTIPLVHSSQAVSS